jgi:hypothetical protein
MRRHILTALATCTLALGLYGAAEAATDGPTCKAECGPRIDEQCGTLQGKALVLAADGGGERRFVVTADAQNDILLNDLPAQPGNPDAIAAVCPGL